MGKNQQMIKLFVVLFISTAFIFSFSHYGAKAFEKMTNLNGKYSDGTTIGALDVSGMSVEDTKSLLEEKYLDWLKDTTMELQYGEKTAPFELNQFHLDSQQTVSSIKDGENNPAFITVDKLQFGEQVKILFPQINSSDLDLDKLLKSLNETASHFKGGTYTFNFYNDYFLAEHTKDAVLNVAVVEMKNVPVDLRTLIEKKPTIQFPEESTFSLLEFAREQKIANADALNIIATGIYQAILPSNFAIAERNIGSTLPGYAKLGYEAKVNQSKMADLVISNPNKAKYLLELKLENNQLKVTLKGEQFIYEYKISSKDEQQLKPKTIIQYSPLLLPGKTKIQTKGLDGQMLRIYREVYQGSQLLKTELISEDYYPPVFQVEVHGLEKSQQDTNQTTGTEGTQPGTTNNNQKTTNSDSNITQTPSPTGTGQQNSNDSDLWGKPNEQPK
ncbi:VanW family protein [Bacillus salipaludis]|uniref:VanW family protein n=1 Tax=Bacillus salipaludis TaxID=2547811 RepID=A0ABW8RFS1_9BACI